MPTTLTEIRLQGEVARLSAKCEHASKLVKEIDACIRDTEFEDGIKKEELRDLADNIKIYLAEC